MVLDDLSIVTRSKSFELPGVTYAGSKAVRGSITDIYQLAVSVGQACVSSRYPNDCKCHPDSHNYGLDCVQAGGMGARP